MRVAYRDQVPMTRLLSTWLPISEGDPRCHANFIQGQDITLDLYPNHENFTRAKEGTSSKSYNCLAEACGGVLLIRSLPKVISMQSIPGWGSSAPGLGLMTTACVPTVFRTGKHSESTLAASMMLASKCPMDVRLQRPSNFDTGSVTK